jgi:hypothetical protein
MEINVIFLLSRLGGDKKILSPGEGDGRRVIYGFIIILGT